MPGEGRGREITEERGKEGWVGREERPVCIFKCLLE